MSYEISNDCKSDISKFKHKYLLYDQSKFVSTRYWTIHPYDSVLKKCAYAHFHFKRSYVGVKEESGHKYLIASAKEDYKLMNFKALYVTCQNIF
jgi:hypothetical protein